MWPSWPPHQALYWTNPSSSDCLKETERTGKICPQQHGSNRLSSWPYVRATGCWKFGWFVWPHRLGKLRGRLLTSTLRQGPIYTYNIFSLLKMTLFSKLVKRSIFHEKMANARARAKIAKFIFRHRRLWHRRSQGLWVQKIWEHLWIEVVLVQW